MAKFTALVACLALLVSAAVADVYMHNPRGSNNRLNERSANRNNGNRMFDSQNNNRGGYNKGDKDTQAFDTNDEQYDMFYYMSAKDHTATEGRSILNVEWTNQHGCGGNEHGDPHKLNCNLVIQYMCIPEPDNFDFAQDRTRPNCANECLIPKTEGDACTDALAPCPLFPWAITAAECAAVGGLWVDASTRGVNDEFNCPDGQGATHNADGELYFRDGLTTARQNFDNPSNGDFTPAANAERERFARKTGDIQANRGLHETWEWYDECYRRERNRGLFTADQNLRNNALGYSSAVYTRQNPNNNRRGYECPEERDYYPYWHPTPWRDIVVMTDRLDLCAFYRNESFNVKAKGLCRNTAGCRNCIRYNSEATCTANNGRWVMQGAHNIAPPECIQAPWSRVNHLGNGRHGQANTYNWTIPYLEEFKPAGAAAYPVTHRCVLRLRYNISTDDYDPWRVDANFNQNNGQGIQSPVRQNPNVDLGAENQALRLAINTAQFGRTFQDRSHVFRLVPREFDYADSGRGGAAAASSSLLKQNNAEFFGRRTLYNVNVRGKRGNIVQTFPSVEYDFVPNQLHLTEEDLVHFQWTGSNTHNNGNPAGDGQAGDAGEGTGGTDRHNVVELKRRHFGESFPNTWEENTLFTNMIDVVHAVPIPTEGNTAQRTDDAATPANDAVAAADLRVRWALRMATSGYIDSPQEAVTKTVNPTLNNVPASFAGGVFRFKRGEYNYMCTRNHNFSNRDQKGVLIVE